MPALRPLEKLSSSGEPVHALLFTYIAAVTWNPTMLGHFLELEKAGKNRSIFLGPRDLSRNCHISISWNCDNSFKLPTCLSAKKNIRSKLQTSCKFSWNFHFCCHNWPSNTSPLDKNLAPALGRTSIRWNMVYLFQCCQAPQALLVLIGELELVAPLLSMCLRWKWDPLFFFFVLRQKLMDFWLQRNGVPGNWCFQHGKKGGNMVTASRLPVCWPTEKIGEMRCHGLNMLKLGLFYSRQVPKLISDISKFSDFFQDSGAEHFPVCLDFYFIAGILVMAIPVTLWEVSNHFEPNSPYLKSCFVLASSHRMSAWCFLFFFFLGDVTFFLVQGIYAQYRQQNHWFQKILLSH